MNKNNLNVYTQIAFKKLKNNVFYDKTAAINRERIVEFEKDDVDQKIKEIANHLEDLETKSWEKYQENILNSIDILIFPKSTKNKATNKKYIINKDFESKIQIDTYQYYIDMYVEGHILGVLWIILFGRYLDNKNSMYKHSYGNRLRATLFEEEKDVSFYPGMFEPYFSQYTTWRDKGIDIAQKQLKSGNDIIILTMDFKRFYYSVDFTEQEFDAIYRKISEQGFSDELYNNKDVLYRLHEFIYAVIKTYSSKLRNIAVDEDLWYQKDIQNCESVNVLPIGFLPSNILANYRLDAFDECINTRWNPLYYGRYVDDIIIVDKIDKKSTIYNKIFQTQEDADKIIKYFMTNCNATKCESCADEASRALLLHQDDLRKDKINERSNLNIIDSSFDEKYQFYYINPLLLRNSRLDIGTCKKQSININNNSLIRVQDNKVKLFVFCSDASDKLLSCFRNEILRNSSEFRFLPEADIIRSNEIYDKLYDLRYMDSINKLSAIEEIKINRFELSKFLGKQMTINSLVKIDKGKNIEEIKILNRILTQPILIDNYSLWERILEMYVLKQSYRELCKFISIINESISNISYYKDKIQNSICQRSLVKIFMANIHRVLALSWGEESDKCIAEVWKKFQKYIDEKDIEEFILGTTQIRKLYLQTRMVNKYLIPISLEWISLKSNPAKCNLFNFNHLLYLLEKPSFSQNEVYKYIPYSVTPQEINFAVLTTRLQKNDSNELTNQTEEYYQAFNYNKFYANTDNNIEARNYSCNKVVEVTFDSKIKKNDELNSTFTSIKNEKKTNIRIGIANTKVFNENLKTLVEGFPNRSLQRYAQIEAMLRSAVHENVDLLVFPENFMPYEWLPRIMSFCSKNQMGIITGIEHLILAYEATDSLPRSRGAKFNVYNLTAVLLPYKLGPYKYTSLTLHSKIYFSPGEIEFLEGYNLNISPGKVTHLFYWHDIYFSVHCCFELASIQLRQSFFKYADLIIGIEHNRDTFYYSNIIESLCRDMHAYCLQVNSSDFGDSRLTQPTSSVFLNIMSVKGGVNNIVIVADLNIDALRRFQLKKYSLQLKDKEFKPTPPGFDTSIVYNKLHGCLDDVIIKNLGNENN